jgi:hypothetical protein
MYKLALLVVVAATGWFSSPASAATPAPVLPLPACIDGQGACGKLNPLVIGTAPGRLTAGSSLLMATVFTGPVCNHMQGYTYVWTPNACYAGVHKPVIVTCAYIDLKDMKFKERSCQSALYRNAAEAPAPLFTLKRPAGNTDYGGSTECGADANYETFAWGGPATIVESTWVARGDRARFCELTMGAKRPDGLYGPTWAKVRVGVSYGEDGIGRSGRPETSEFYIPIDGDLRETGPDVSVTATTTLDESTRALGDSFATYRVTLTNRGDQSAENFRLEVVFPDQLLLQKPVPAVCTVGEIEFLLPGANFPCNNLRLAAGSAVTLSFTARITNSADLEPVTFTALVDSDLNPGDNDAEATVRPTLDAGSLAATVNEMRILLAYNPNLYVDAPKAIINTGSGEACNTYQLNFWDRLEAIRAAHPEAFDRLSYGRITSQPAGYQPGDSTSGHYGVVIYLKGTNYHQTGVVVHGTAGPSRYPFQSETIVGNDEIPRPTDYGGTTMNGKFIRTPITSFQGSPRQEAQGTGFEGKYPATAAPPASGPTCPIAPAATVVGTQSPVEIHLRNALGQRVETLNGKVVVQELPVSIHSYAIPHGDGTYAWNLILPRDDYEVTLVGTGDGPYKLTMTTYKDGQPVERVIDGVARPRVTETFALQDKPLTAAPQNPDPPGGQGNSGGGGAMDHLLLVALVTLLLASRRCRNRRVTLI